MKSYAVNVLARQATEKLRQCCTGTANHCAGPPWPKQVWYFHTISPFPMYVSAKIGQSTFLCGLYSNATIKYTKLNQWKAEPLIYLHGKPLHWSITIKASTALSQCKSYFNVGRIEKLIGQFLLQLTLESDLYCESTILALVKVVQCCGLLCQ